MKWISRGFLLLLLLALLFVDFRLLDASLLSKKTLVDVLLLMLFGVLMIRRAFLPFNDVSRLYLLLLGLYIAIIGLGSFNARNPSDAMFLMFSDAQLFFLFLGLLLVFPSSEDFLKALKLPIFLYAYAAIILAFVQILEVSGSINLTADTSYSITSFFAHRNLFSHQLVFIFPFLLYFSFERGIGRYFSIFALLLLLPLLVMLFCRSAWLAFILGGGMIFLGILFIPMKSSVKRVFLLSPVMLGVMALLSAYLFMDGEDLWHHLDSLMNWHYGSALKRRHLWTSTIDLIHENPFFGIGTADWKIEINRYIASLDLTESGRIFYQRPHNDFLWIWSENGIFAALAFASLLIIAFRNAFISAKNGDQNAMIGLFGLTAYLVIAFLSFPRERIEHHVFLVFFLFLSVPKLKKNRVIQGRTFFIFILIPLIIAAIIDFIRYDGEMNLKAAQHLKDAGEMEKALAKYNLAENAFYQVDGLSTPVSFYRGLAELKLREKEEALVSFKRAKSMNPYHLQTLNNLGILYISQSMIDSSLQQFRQGLALDPDFNDARVNMAMVQGSSGDLKGALVTLQGMDLSQLNPQQTDQLLIVLRARMSQLISAESNIERKNCLERINISDAWMTDMFKKHIAEGRDFEEQVNLDVDYLIRDEG